MAAQYVQGHEQIAEGHDRHKDFGEPGDALEAAEDDRRQQACDQRGTGISRQTEGVVEGGGDGV
ncbi:hypothetical protein D3C85_1294300 [compost metagenome]